MGALSAGSSSDRAHSAAQCKSSSRVGPCRRMVSNKCQNLNGESINQKEKTFGSISNRSRNYVFIIIILITPTGSCKTRVYSNLYVGVYKFVY